MQVRGERISSGMLQKSSQRPKKSSVRKQKKHKVHCNEITVFVINPIRFPGRKKNRPTFKAG